MSSFSEKVYQYGQCAIGVCNSVISKCAEKMGSSFFAKYYNIGPSNVVLTAIDIYRDKNHRLGPIAGFLSSLATGALVGAACPGMLGAIGGAILGSVVSSYVSDAFNNFTDYLRACAGINPNRSPGGSGGPGGVEFRKIEPLSDFDKAEIVLSRKCNLFFETDNEKSAREAFNAICLPNFRNRTMKEYYETIMAEIYQFTLNGGNLPFISLHFNKNGILYSVMNPLYKQTLIGNTLTFLDYFLKGFVNGGFFNIEFVHKWKSNPTVNLDELNRNLIDIRKELKKIRSGYQSLYALLDEDYYGKEFTSAFRIVGEISETCQLSGQTFLPDSGFIVESDLFASASFQKIMNTDSDARNKWIKITIAHNRMKYLVHNLMPLVPEFTGYFEILKMICFALHYSESLDSVGLKAETDLAFQNQSNQYVEIIPETFPPLPVRKSVKLDPKITYGDVLNTISTSSFDHAVNQMMEKKISDFTDNDFYSMEEKIRQMYIERINKQAASHHLSALDDDDIELETFIMISISVIRALKCAFESLFASFYKSIINQMKEYLEIDKKEVKQKLSKTELEYFNVNENDSTNPQLRKQCCNIFKLFLENSNQQFVKKLIPDSYKQEEMNPANKKIDQQRNEAIKHYDNQFKVGKEAIEKITANIKQINDFEEQYNALDYNTRNMAQNIETINKARQQRADLEKSLSDVKRQIGEIESEINRINEETNSLKAQNNENRLKQIKEMRQQMIENIKLFKEKYDEYDEYYHHPSQINQKDFTFFEDVIDWAISISIPIIQNGQNSTSIRGGCLVRSQKSCNIINQELSIEDENKIKECVSNGKDFVILNDKKGFLVNFKLQSYEYSL